MFVSSSLLFDKRSEYKALVFEKHPVEIFEVHVQGAV
jgi:hypothetical protein